MAYIDKKVALQYLANSETLFDKLKKRFLENHKDGAEKVSKYVIDNDLDGLYNYIHSIKGVSLNIGSIPLYDDSEALLAKLKMGVVNIQLIDMFVNTLTNVLDELSKI